VAAGATRRAEPAPAKAGVKLLAQEGELYVLAQSRDRVAKERAMRRRQLKRLWARLKQLSTMPLTREELLMKLGAARDQLRSAWRLVAIEVAADSSTFSYRLDRNKLRQTRLREGRYLLRTNLFEEDPAKLWSHYLLLVAVEEAFKNLKGDLAIRPVFHQLEARVEAHVFIAFLAYCLHVTLARRLHALAPGLTPRSVLEKFAAVQMIDVHLPTTDGRELVLTRNIRTTASARHSSLGCRAGRGDRSRHRRRDQHRLGMRRPVRESGISGRSSVISPPVPLRLRAGAPRRAPRALIRRRQGIVSTVSRRREVKNATESAIGLT
jgi:hypothetical protein